MNDDTARLNDIVAAFQRTLVIPANTAPGTPTPGQGVSVANGYTYDLPFANVYLPAQQDILNSDDPAVFPKIVFALDGGNFALGASRRGTRTCRLSIMVIIKEANQDVLDINERMQIPGWRPVGDQVRDLKDDIEKAILKNLTLGGIVDRCVPSDFETDSNFSYPNGVIVVWADVLYYNN